jgi:hypothetical protein
LAEAARLSVNFFGHHWQAQQLLNAKIAGGEET